MYISHNINPYRKYTGDCVIRAIGIATNKSWDDVYLDIALEGFVMKEMPSDNDVWASYLKKEAFKRYIIPDSCPDCYTISDFANDNPVGKFILATGSHVVPLIDGNYIDTWDSGQETVVYYFEKED